MTKPPVIPAVAITREFLCKQALELSDVARENRDFATSLASLDFIATLKGMYEDPDRL